jgi:hypothetical protein
MGMSVCSNAPLSIKMSWVIDVKDEYTPVPKHSTLKVHKGMKLKAVHIFWSSAVGGAYVSLDSDAGGYHFQPSHDSSEKCFWCCCCWTCSCPAWGLWLHWLIWAGCDVWNDKKFTFCKKEIIKYNNLHVRCRFPFFTGYLTSENV